MWCRIAGHTAVTAFHGGQVTGTTRVQPPLACGAEERKAFARMVREGFPGAQRLADRIRQARWLAFHHDADGTLTAVAALKAPGARYREQVFRQAETTVSPAACPLELGWIFVRPAHRGKGIAERLCRELLVQVPTSSVFATTRPDNHAMIRILDGLGFERLGRPYARRDEQLVLFVRPAPAAAPPASP